MFRHIIQNADGFYEVRQWSVFGWEYIGQDGCDSFYAWPEKYRHQHSRKERSVEALKSWYESVRSAAASSQRKRRKDRFVGWL